MNRKKLALVIGGGVLVASAGLLTLRGDDTAQAAEPSADVAMAELRDLVVRAEAAGKIEPIRVVEVKSKASGEILRMRVSTGDYVEAGTILAEIDPRDVQNALDQAEADQAVAEVQMVTSRAQRNRVEELRAVNAVTQQELEGAIQSEASAQAALVRARTNLLLAQVRRGDVQIAAPISGTIIERPVEAGQIIASATGNVSGGTTLLRMADLSEMQVRALVDETDIGRVASGQQVDVSVDAFPGMLFSGQVLKVEPQAVVEQNVTMFPVLVLLGNREGLLRPGMNAEVSIDITRRTQVVTVPADAVVSLADAPATGRLMRVAPGAVDSVTASVPLVDAYDSALLTNGLHSLVFVQNGGRVDPRLVLIGASDWDYAEVVEGLDPGETVKLVSVVRLRAQQANQARGPFGRRGGDDEGGD